MIKLDRVNRTNETDRTDVKASWVPLALLVPLVLLLLPSCVSLEQMNLTSDIQSYSLSVSRPESGATQEDDTALYIRKFSISSQFEDRFFNYKISASNFESDFYNQFLASPSDIFTEVTREWFRDAPLVQYVVDTKGNLAVDYELQGMIEELYADYQDETNPTAVLKIQFSLVRETQVPREFAFQKTYLKKMSLEQITTQHLVSGWSAALTEILTEFEADLTTVIKSV